MKLLSSNTTFSSYLCEVSRWTSTGSQFNTWPRLCQSFSMCIRWCLFPHYCIAPKLIPKSFKALFLHHVLFQPLATKLNPLSQKIQEIHTLKLIKNQYLCCFCWCTYTCTPFYMISTPTMSGKVYYDYIYIYIFFLPDLCFVYKCCLKWAKTIYRTKYTFISLTKLAMSQLIRESGTIGS